MIGTEISLTCQTSASSIQLRNHEQVDFEIQVLAATQ